MTKQLKKGGGSAAGQHDPPRQAPPTIGSRTDHSGQRKRAKQNSYGGLNGGRSTRQEVPTLVIQIAKRDLSAGHLDDAIGEQNIDVRFARLDTLYAA